MRVTRHCLGFTAAKVEGCRLAAACTQVTTVAAVFADSGLHLPLWAWQLLPLGSFASFACNPQILLCLLLAVMAP